MNTTSIFVELVIIGFQSLIWVGLFVLTIVGPQKMPIEKLLTLNMAVPALAAGYILGILIDRLSDIAFIPADHRLRKEHDLHDLPPFLTMRFYILHKSKDSYDQLEYTRSRLRIARAAFLNFILISIASMLFVLIRMQQAFSAFQLLATSLFLGGMGLLLTWISYRAWAALTHTYIDSTVTAFKVVRGDVESGK